jgi:hypothetical protein
MTSTTARTQHPHGREQDSPSATWNDLPPEITNEIFIYVCKYIIEEFEMYGRDPWNPDYQNYAPIKLGPEGPYPLRLYTNLLHTCRFFYQTITHGIKIDGESVVEILQKVQHDAFSQILDGLANRDCALWFRIVPITVKLVGFFWNNPSIREDALIVDFYGMISHRDGANLIPYFDNFISDLVKDQGLRSFPSGFLILLESAVYIRIGTYVWTGNGDEIEVMSIAGIEGFKLSNRGLKVDGTRWTEKDMKGRHL